MSDDINALKEAEKEKLSMLEVEPLSESEPAPVAAKRAEGRVCAPHGSGRWVWGILLIGLGAFALAGRGFPVNWWAIFLIAPGLTKLMGAVGEYRELGGLSGRGQERLAWGIILTLLGSMWLLGWSWSLFWPVLLVGLGLAWLLGSMARAA